jgi:plastocyanin
VCRVRKIMLLIGMVTVVAAGCGGGSSTTASNGSASGSNGAASTPVSLPGTTNNKGTKTPSGNEIEVEMDDFYFNPTFIQGKPGQTLTLHLKNEGKNTHTFTSAALGVDQTLQPDKTADVQVTLPQSGATEFHCNFHQSSGMQGAFFFNTGDVVGGAGAGAKSGSTTTSTTSTTTSNNGGYNYPN